MSEDETKESESVRHDIEMNRRNALKYLSGGVLAASAARVGYEVTGYGTVSGTNLTEQELEPLARETLRATEFDLPVQDGHLRFDGQMLAYAHGGQTQTSVEVQETTPDAAAETGDEYGVAAPFRELTADIDALAAGEVRFEFSSNEAFFERIDEATPRPFTVAALRGDRFGDPDPETLQEFAGCGPEDPAALVEGLATGFRDNAHFDVERWIVFNVEDHVLLNTLQIKEYVSEQTGFEELVEGSTGLYCWEYARRSLAAFHAAHPHNQSPPVFGAVVTDDRHNHMFTGIASAVRDGGDLVLPMTFVDYSHSTMYDSYGLQWALGSGVDAYSTQHRATEIRYTW
jgi:hypothetical protein